MKNSGEVLFTCVKPRGGKCKGSFGGKKNILFFKGLFWPLEKITHVFLQESCNFSMHAEHKIHLLCVSRTCNIYVMSFFRQIMCYNISLLWSIWVLQKQTNKNILLSKLNSEKKKKAKKKEEFTQFHTWKKTVWSPEEPYYLIFKDGKTFFRDFERLSWQVFISPPLLK